MELALRRFVDEMSENPAASAAEIEDAFAAEAPVGTEQFDDRVVQRAALAIEGGKRVGTSYPPIT